MSNRERGPTARDYRRCLEVVGAVQELLGSGEPLEARRLILEASRRVLGGAAVFWTVLDEDQRTSSDPARTALDGLDQWQIDLWRDPFFNDAKYREDPLWENLERGRGTVRTWRRADVIASEASWFEHPAHELARALGMADEVASMAPLGGRQECMLVVARGIDDPRFGERERHLLHALHGALRGAYRLIAEPLLDAVGRPTVSGLRLRLAPRHRAIFDQLLTGRGEKEIAAAVGLSPRTVHKYVEAIFRAASVSSRAELMASFISGPGRGSM